MKKNTHPAYNSQATITCACGATYQVGSTQDKTQIELCSACHPFYTGTQKIVDTARRVEKFKARAAKKSTGAKNMATKKADKKAKRSAKGTKYEIETTKTAVVKKRVAKKEK